MSKFDYGDIIQDKVTNNLFEVYAALVHNYILIPLQIISGVPTKSGVIGDSVVLGALYVDSNFELVTPADVAVVHQTPIPSGSVKVHAPKMQGPASPFMFAVDDILECTDIHCERYIVTACNTAFTSNEYVLKRKNEGSYYTLGTDFVHKMFMRIGSVKYTPNSVTKTAQSCAHDWAIYDSGFSYKEYCRKCNVDKAAT